jgi:hypothetical protein
LAKFFGFEFKRIEEPYLKQDRVANDSISFVDRDAETSAAVISASPGSFGTYVDTQGNIKTEAELITKYRDMAIAPEIDNAVEEIVNQAIIADEDYVVKIDLEDIPLDDQAKQIMEQEFQEVLRLLDFNSLSYYTFRRWYIDGRLYYHAVIDPKRPQEGIKEIRYVDPRKLREIKEVIEKPIGGAVSNQAATVQITKNEYYLYNERGFTPISKAMIGQNNATSGIRISKDSIIHVPSGITDTNGMLGLSYLHIAIKILNQLRTIEDSLIIYRLARAPERRVWNIDVGNMPGPKAEQFMKSTIANMKNRLIYDSDTGVIRDDRKFLTMLEDYYLPKRADGSGTTVTTLPAGQTLGEIEDIVYFQKQLYDALRVPVDRLHSDAPFQIGDPGNISRQEIKFDKFITRLRQQFSLLFTQTLGKNLVLKGFMTIEEFDSFKKQIRYEYARDVHIAELKDAQVLSARVESYMGLANAQLIGKYYSNKWVRRNVFQQTEEDIEKMTEQIAMEMQDPLYNQPTPEEQQAEAEAEAQAQAGGDQQQQPAGGGGGGSSAEGAANKKYNQEQKVDNAKHVVAALKDIKGKTPQDIKKLRTAAQMLSKSK